MKAQTIQLLNQLNHEFYQNTATHFDASRSAAWEGWQPLLPYLQNAAKRPHWQLLDVGCGNGRWGTFWAQEVGFPCHYTGIDLEPYLLARAKESLSAVGLPHHLVQRDVVMEGLALQESYDLITLFGVMHHIPSFGLRRGLIQNLMQHLKPNGLLVLTFWRFYELDRFRRRVVAWDDARVPSQYHHLDLEAQDYLLDWRQGQTALRYCHYVDAAEQEELLAGYALWGEYSADTCNQYILLRL